MPGNTLVGLPASTRDSYVLLDTNLLILCVTASIGPVALKAFKRLKTEFDERDVLLLLELIRQFKAPRTTAYVLAEASNLANALSGHLRAAWFQELSTFAIVTGEEHVGTNVVGLQPEVIPFGVADAALSYLSRDHTVVTTDGRLYAYLQGLGRRVVNFNHLRPAWMNNDV